MKMNQTRRGVIYAYPKSNEPVPNRYNNLSNSESRIYSTAAHSSRVNTSDVNIISYGDDIDHHHNNNNNSSGIFDTLNNSGMSPGNNTVSLNQRLTHMMKANSQLKHELQTYKSKMLDFSALQTEIAEQQSLIKQLRSQNDRLEYDLQVARQREQNIIKEKQDLIDTMKNLSEDRIRNCLHVELENYRKKHALQKESVNDSVVYLSPIVPPRSSIRQQVVRSTSEVDTSETDRMLREKDEIIRDKDEIIASLHKDIYTFSTCVTRYEKEIEELRTNLKEVNTALTKRKQSPVRSRSPQIRNNLPTPNNSEYHIVKQQNISLSKELNDERKEKTDYKNKLLRLEEDYNRIVINRDSLQQLCEERNNQVMTLKRKVETLQQQLSEKDIFLKMHDGHNKRD